MRTIEYFDGQRVRKLKVHGLFDQRQQAPRMAANRSLGRAGALSPMRPQAAGAVIATSLQRQSAEASDSGKGLRLDLRFRSLSESTTEITAAEPGETSVIPTETIAISDASRADVSWLRNRYGMVEIDSRKHGKVLMRSPDDAGDGVGHAAGAALALHHRAGSHGQAHPNFIRVVQRTPQSPNAPAVQWGLSNPGDPGIVGSDTHAEAAWTISEGSDDIRVAILDEGVDTGHPYLAAAVAAETDFVDSNPTAMPDGDDAHGTACAGIVCSRGRVAGLAKGASLVAARIAKSSGDVWLFDDFNTADAIDWCWDDAQADVLSNSWGGGPPAPLITAAFERARTQGRGGQGAVIVISAGNDSRSSLNYPANLPGTVAVGASNQWDKRKTRSSADGENWWGTNYGTGLDLMAPGVHIVTTDIRGRRGYSRTQVTNTFNGTSAAGPFVAATAALVLSVMPTLGEAEVRKILNATADPLSRSGKWSRYTGHGRVNAYHALWAARR